MVILDFKHVSKTYESPAGAITVLDDIDLTLMEGQTCAIVGPSGSGKTTLLGLCAGLDRPTTGTIDLCGIRINDLDEDQLAMLRNQHIGFIFQNFQLLPTLTALENVVLPLELQGKRQVRQTGKELLDRVGLLSRADHYPSQLSGGEQQRVALARAFANRPRILFADEPTGNLDHENGELVTRMLFDLNKEAGTTLVIVTHDLELAARTQHIIHIKAGKTQHNKEMQL